MGWLRMAAMAAVAFMAGWSINGWRLNGIHAEYRESIANQSAEASEAVRSIMAQAQADAETLDRQHTQELSDAQSEIAHLRDDVRDGRRRLSVNAACPGLSSTPGAAGVGNAGSARLTDAAERDYWRLRERIETGAAQLSALQDYVRTVCRPGTQ